MEGQKTLFGQTASVQTASSRRARLAQLVVILSARLVQLVQWHAPPNHIPWIHYERASIDPYYLLGLLWSSSVRPKFLTSLNGEVSPSLHLWSLYRTKYTLIPPKPRLAFFLGDPRFPSAFTSDCDFSKWI